MKLKMRNSLQPRPMSLHREVFIFLLFFFFFNEIFFVRLLCVWFVNSSSSHLCDSAIGGEE